MAKDSGKSKMDTGTTYAGIAVSGFLAFLGISNATGALGLEPVGVTSGLAMGFGFLGMAIFSGFSLAQ